MNCQLENENSTTITLKEWIENFRLRTQFLNKIFLVIIVVLLILDICWIGCITINHENSKKTYIPVTGKIVDKHKELDVYIRRYGEGDYTYTVKIEYIVNGITYTTDYNSAVLFENKEVGEEAEFLCDPNNPNNIETEEALKNEFIIIVIILGVLAFVFLLLVLFFIYNIAKVNKIREQRELEGGDTRGELSLLKLSNIRKEDWEKEIEQTLLKKEKATKIFLAVLIFVVVPILCWNIVDCQVKIRDYVPVTGKIVDMYNDLVWNTTNTEITSSHKKLIVQYDVNGITYTSECPTNTFIGKHRGSQFKIRYNPDNPSEIYSYEIPWIGILIVAIPIFIIIGLSYNLIRTHKIKKRRQGLCEEREL